MCRLDIPLCALNSKKKENTPTGGLSIRVASVSAIIFRWALCPTWLQGIWGAALTFEPPGSGSAIRRTMCLRQIHQMGFEVSRLCYAGVEECVCWRLFKLNRFRTRTINIVQRIKESSFSCHASSFASLRSCLSSFRSLNRFLI